MSEQRGFWFELLWGKEPRSSGITVTGGEVGPGHYGSAKWGGDALTSLPEMLAHPNGSSWIPVSRSLQDGDVGTVWDPHYLQGHALTLAPTRAGKGVSAIIPALLTYAGSCLVLDVKGENAWVTATRRRAFGQRVVILDPWGEVNRRYGDGQAVETAASFNPLAALDPTDPYFADDVAAMASVMVISSGSDPHWGDTARELVAGCIAAVVEARPGTATLWDVRQLLLMGSEKFAERVEWFQKLNPTGLGSRKLDGFKEASKENDSVRSTAKTQTAFLDSEHLKAAMESSSEPFDLAELGQGRVTLYLVIPENRLETHGRWLRLIMAMALQACSRQAQPASLPVLFLLDEFGTIGRLPMVERAFGLAAGSGAGVRLWCFLQDLPQLKRDYPESWETFFSNASLVQVLAARDATTAEYISKLIGEASLYRSERIVFQDMPSAVGGAYQRPDRHVQGERDVQRPLIYPAEITKMSKDRQVVLFSGCNPIMSGRFVYFDTYEWAEEYRPMPGKPAKRKEDFDWSYENFGKRMRLRAQTRHELGLRRLDTMSKYKVLILPVWLPFIILDPLYSRLDLAIARLFPLAGFKKDLKQAAREALRDGRSRVTRGFPPVNVL